MLKVILRINSPKTSVSGGPRTRLSLEPLYTISKYYEPIVKPLSKRYARLQTSKTDSSCICTVLVRYDVETSIEGGSTNAFWKYLSRDCTSSSLEQENLIIPKSFKLCKSYSLGQIVACIYRARPLSLFCKKIGCHLKCAMKRNFDMPFIGGRIVQKPYRAHMRFYYILNFGLFIGPRREANAMRKRISLGFGRHSIMRRIIRIGSPWWQDDIRVCLQDFSTNFWVHDSSPCEILVVFWRGWCEVEITCITGRWWRRTARDLN